MCEKVGKESRMTVSGERETYRTNLKCLKNVVKDFGEGFFLWSQRD